MSADRDAERRHDRKEDHVRLASMQWEPTQGDVPPDRSNEFDDLDFVHHAMDAVALESVEPATRMFDRTVSWPIYINGMTGGTAHTGRINQQLAIAAHQTGLAMGCGSVSIALDDPDAAPGFRIIRRENPDGLVMANIGVGRSADDARRAVDLLGADALQVHINAVQETVMPEGSPHFGGWMAGIEAIVAASPVPVLVKEVGFGLSPRTLRRLADIGVQFADVSGKGGTDFLRIENDRRPGGDYGYLTGFGQSAPACLLDASTLEAGFRPTLFASGGVRNPLDVLKALALGAEAVGVAGAFLSTVVEVGAEGLIDLIRGWQRHTRELMALLGAYDLEGLRTTDLLIRGRLGEYARLRGIDARTYARRRES